MNRIPTISRRLPKQYDSHNQDRMYRAASIRIECLKRCGIPNPNIRGLQEDFRLC
jgi:hypothetical protein